MSHCYECGASQTGATMHPVGDHYLCARCGEKVRDVMELAASLHVSIYDLCTAVTP